MEGAGNQFPSPRGGNQQVPLSQVCALRLELLAVAAGKAGRGDEAPLQGDDTRPSGTGTEPGPPPARSGIPPPQSLPLPGAAVRPTPLGQRLPAAWLARAHPSRRVGRAHSSPPRLSCLRPRLARPTLPPRPARAALRAQGPGQSLLWALPFKGHHQQALRHHCCHVPGATSPARPRAPLKGAASFLLPKKAAPAPKLSWRPQRKGGRREARSESLLHALCRAQERACTWAPAPGHHGLGHRCGRQNLLVSCLTLWSGCPRTTSPVTTENRSNPHRG